MASILDQYGRPIKRQELGKPVIAINTATYWHALRQLGINEKLPGFGRLLSEH